MRSSALVLLTGLLLSACGGAQQGPSSATNPGSPPSEPAAVTGTDSPATPGELTASADGTTIRFTVPKVGSSRTETQDFALNMEVSEIDKGKKKRSERVVEQRHTLEHATVLATDGKAITKKKVRYDRHEISRARGEHMLDVPSPLTGKTYVLSLSGGKLVATRDNGEPVSDIEMEKLGEDNRSFGKPPKFSSFVPNRPLKPGDSFKPDRDALFEMFGPGDKQFGDVEFRFEGEEKVGNEPAARFSFVATIAEKSGVTMRSKGHVLLMVNSGWPLELVMNADVTLEAPGGAPGQTVAGAGKAQMRLAAEYH
jgi:hypothetical protein